MPSRERVRQHRIDQDYASRPAEQSDASFAPGASATRHDGQPLSDTARSALEPRFGHSFENVRIFDDAASHASTRAIEASAFTVGESIFFSRDSYEPETPVGLHLLAHELAHTVQQRAARGTPRRVSRGGESAELDADLAADAVLLGDPVSINSSSGESVLAREEESKGESEAERAARVVQQFPWMGAFFPEWTKTLGKDGLRAVKTDGTTTRERSADIGVKDGFSAQVGQKRVIEGDKDHSLQSHQEAGYGDGAFWLGWGSGGKSLADDGTKESDERSAKITLGPDNYGAKYESTSTRDTVTKSTSADVSYKGDKFDASLDWRRLFKLDSDNQMSSGYGVKVGNEGFNVSSKQDSRIKDVEQGTVESQQSSKTFGYGKDGFNAGYSSNKTTQVGDQTFSSGTGMSYGNGNFTLTRSSSQGTVDESGEAKTTAGTSTGFTVGKGGASMTRTVTDDKGNTTGYSGGGDVGFDPSGNLSHVELKGGISRNGKSVSASAGYDVHASEPRQEGDHFVVDWERTFSAGGGAGAKGVGISGGHANSEFGSRVFKTKDEAEAFQKNAAAVLPSHAHDPSTVEGAMYLEVGESRGNSSSTTGGVGVSISPTAGSIGVGASSTSSGSTSVRRVSPTIFQLSRQKMSMSGKSLSASTIGMGATAQKSSDETTIVTVQVDVSTPEGKAAFEKFSQSGDIATGAQVISQSEISGESSGQTASLPGASSTRTGRYEEATTRDQSGTTKRFTGEATETNAQTVPFFKSHDNMDVRFDAINQNDKESFYSIKGSVDSTSGDDSMRRLHQLTQTATRTNEGATSSGKWGVDVELTDQLVNQFVSSINSEKDRDVGIFDHTARDDLRKQIHEAKTPDDQKRAIARFFSQEGFEGKAIGAMRDEIFGVKNQFLLTDDYDMLKANKLGNFEYDLTLPGDKNFRGIAGRKELEGKISQLQKLMGDNPKAAGSLHGSVHDLLQEVSEQRAEIADPKRYTDLPTELREMQVARIDAYLSQLNGMAQQADVAFTEADIEEPPATAKGSTKHGKGGAKGAHAKHEDDGKGGDPALKAFKKLRSDIGSRDRMMEAAKKRYNDARQAVGVYFNQGLAKIHGSLSQEIRDAVREAQQLDRESQQFAQAAQPAEPGIGTLRSQYIDAIGNPETAATLGAGLLGQLTTTSETWELAAEKIETAQDVLRNAIEGA